MAEVAQRAPRGGHCLLLLHPRADHLVYQKSQRCERGEREGGRHLIVRGGALVDIGMFVCVGVGVGGVVGGVGGGVGLGVGLGCCFLVADCVMCAMVLVMVLMCVMVVWVGGVDGCSVGVGLGGGVSVGFKRQISARGSLGHAVW